MLLAGDRSKAPRRTAASPADRRDVPTWLYAFGAVAGIGLLGMVVTLVVPAGRITDVLLALLDDPAIAFAVVALLFARSRSQGMARRVWGLFALGAAAWLAGEVLFEVRDALGHGSDVSIADVFYLLFYPPVMAGLLLLGRGDRRVRHAGQSLDAVIVMAAAALLLWVLVRTSLLSASGSPTTQIVNVAYVVLDLGLLWLLVLPALRSDVPWTRTRTLIAWAFAGILLADTVWISTDTELYGLLASTSLLMLGIAAADDPRLIGAEPETRRRRRLAAESAVVASGAFAIGLLDWMAIGGGMPVDLVLGVTVLLALVLARLLLGISTEERLLSASEERASTDPLTGLLNHGSFNEHLDREIHRAQRAETPLSLLLVDLDHLKAVNDLAGHRAGDRVIRQLADLLRRMSRETDLVCRIGGDEMAVIAPATDPVQAGELAERLVRAARTLHIDGLGEPSRLTVSIGVAGFPATAVDKPGLVEHADDALYGAKNAGRDRWHEYVPDAIGPDAALQLARTRARLAARESDFRAVFTHALEPMMIADEQTTILDVNEAAIRLGGATREAIVGRRLSDFIVPDDRPILTAALRRLDSFAHDEGELHALLPDGRATLIEFSASRFSPERFLVGLRDIGERTQAQHELALSESRFRALFDGANDAIFITDDDGRVLDANPAASRLSERSRPELLGVLVADLVAPEERDDTDVALETLQRERTLTGTGTFVDGAGRRRTLEWSSVADFVPGQHLSLVRDITQRGEPTTAVQTGRARSR